MHDGSWGFWGMHLFWWLYRRPSSDYSFVTRKTRRSSMQWLSQNWFAGLVFWPGYNWLHRRWGQS